MGIRLADFVVAHLRRRGTDVELIDAKEVNLPLLDRMSPTKTYSRQFQTLHFSILEDPQGDRSVHNQH